MKRALLALALVVVVLAAVTLERTVSFRSRQPQVAPVAVEPLDTAALARRLAGALRFKTISFQDSSQFDERAVEHLVAAGTKPRRTLYLAFGYDEEVGGRRGAARIAELLAARNVHPEFVLDEGGALATGLITGVAAPVALIGIAEKGYVTVELTAQAEGGHSSMPPPATAVGILAAGLTRLEAHQMPP